VLLAEEDGRVVGSVAISFVRMSIAGEEVKTGMPVHLATDPAYRGRGIFGELQAANEERARAVGARLLFVVPTPASASVLRGRLSWTPLPSLRVWARPRVLPVRRAHPEGSGDRVLRDDAWLDWRFAEAPRRYTLVANGGYAVLGQR